MYDFIFSSMLADGPEMTATYVASVVITGIVVVFLALLILICFFKLLGLTFGGEKKPEDAVTAQEVKAEPIAVVENKPLSAPAYIDDSVEEEIVAVIMAAISAMGEQSGKKLRLVGIKPAVRASRPVWAQAGLIENTRPF